PVNFMSRRRDRRIVPSTCFSFYQLIKAPWHCQLGGRKLFAVKYSHERDRWNGEVQSGGRYRGHQFALRPAGAALDDGHPHREAEERRLWLAGRRGARL